MTTQQYQQASEHFLAQARQELADGDFPHSASKFAANTSKKNDWSPN